MKRVEVKLSLPVVAPLVDLIRELTIDLERSLAAPQARAKSSTRRPATVSGWSRR